MPVKSADRILEILELFDDIRQPMSVNEVADELGYPQSSTSELLQTLSLRGYIYYSPSKRRYAPTLLISLLGEWGLARNSLGKDLLGLIRELRLRTGCTISVAVPDGVNAKLIRVVRSDKLPRLPGTLRPICHCASGQMLVSTFQDAEIGKLVRRINASAAPDKYRVQDTSTFMQTISEIRKRGYSRTRGTYEATLGGIAALVPVEKYPTAIAVSIGGPLDFIDDNATHLVDVLQKSIDEYSGLRFLTEF